MHRVANAALAAAVVATLAAWALDASPPETILARASLWSLYASPFFGVAAALFAHRFSIVERIAGGDGNDELPDRAA